MGVPLKWRNSPVNYFRITFLSALSEKKFRYCFVCMSREALFGTQIYYLWIFRPSVPSFCRSGIPVSWEPILFNTGLSTPENDVPSCLLRLQGFTCWQFMVQSGVTVGLDFLQEAKNHSHSFTYYPHSGAEPQEASQGTAVDVMPLFIHYRSDSCLPQSPFPVVVRWGSRYPGGWFCVRVSPIWILSNVASGAQLCFTSSLARSFGKHTPGCLILEISGVTITITER